MTRFALTLEFDGEPFAGLQRQANAPSVQGAVEDAVLAVTGEQVTLHAAGRTDTGVHALAMRHGIEDRDYAKEIAQWRELAAAVEADAEEEEQTAIRLVLAAASSHKVAS